MENRYFTPSMEDMEIPTFDERLQQAYEAVQEMDKRDKTGLSFVEIMKPTQWLNNLLMWKAQMEDEIEVWKPVVGYDGIYEVSSFGQVRRVSYLLKPSNSHYGYPQLTLTKNGKNSNKPLHRIVAEAFHENPENKPTVNHKDGNKQNSHKNNLEWATHSENSLHAVRTGLRTANWQDGEKNPKAKLKKEQVLDIREKCETMKVSEVHKNHYPQLSYNTIYGIKTKRLWKNL